MLGVDINKRSGQENDLPKKIPESLEKIENELKVTKSKKRAMLLNYALTSRSNNRYTNRAMMLLVGESGAGKSSIINHLFGNTYAKTSGKESCTKDTTEWYIQSNVDELLIQGLKLSIVDSPGFNDTDGGAQESVNMACIKAFFRSYPSAQDEGLFPNFVLLTVNATNNRYKGEHSTFTKSLRALVKTGVVDQKHPNVLVVITHVLNVGPNKDSFSRENKEKGDDIADICRAYLGFKPNYVFLENMPGKYNLPIVKDKEWLTVLPNGTEQPANFFKALRELAGDGDPIGKLSVSHFLSVLEQEPLTKGHHVSSNEMITNADLNEIFNENHTKSELEKIMDMQVVIDPSIERDAMLLVAALKNKDIDTVSELKKMDTCTISSTINMFLNANQMKFLANLQVAKANYKKLNISIGESYDIFNDNKVQKSVYKLEEQNHAYYNFEFSSNIDLTKENEIIINAETLDNSDAYIKTRLHQLNVHLDKYDSKYFKFAKRAPKAGLNYAKNKDLTFSIVSSLFSLKLRENSKVISESFKKDVEDLPDNYIKGDKKNADKFKKFFQSWGSHVIIEQRTGGFIEGIIKKNILPNEAIKKEIFAKICAVDEEIQKDHTPALTMDASLKWKGGDQQQHVTLWRNLNKDNCSNWGNSLPYEAVALDSYQLEPIHEPVKKIDQTKAWAVEEAFKDQTKVDLHDVIGATRAETRRKIIGVSGAVYMIGLGSAAVLFLPLTGGVSIILGASCFAVGYFYYKRFVRNERIFADLNISKFF